MKIIAVASGLALLVAAAAWGLAQAQATGGSTDVRPHLAASGKKATRLVRRRHGPPAPLLPLAKKGALTDTASSPHSGPMPLQPLAKKGAVTDAASGPATPK